MRLDYEVKDLHLIHPFILSDSRYSTKTVIIVRVHDQDITGIGESSPSKYYGEPPASVCACLDLAKIILGTFSDPLAIDQLNELLLHHFPDNPSARSGIIMAVCDWIGKKSKLPLYKFFNLDKSQTPRTSFTIGIDDLEMIEQKIREAEPYPILKIKLGVGDRDYDIVKTIRNTTDKILRVDVNEGWDREEAYKKIAWLKSQNVELVEQPLPKEKLDDMAWLKKRSALPLFADENVMTSDDIPKLVPCFHGINIKLDKCGGLREAIRMLRTARELNLQTMLGCMIQTSVGISAAAQISPLADYADLDGHLLIQNDPYSGIAIENGKIILNDEPGIGVLVQGHSPL
jgi:L-alanine-DL-glutamate epimerase-like enolase superfamily enzyme